MSARWRNNTRPEDGGCYMLVSYGRNVWGFELIAFWSAEENFMKQL